MSYSEITDSMVADVASFVPSFNMELGYLCSHRRMKKYITEDGVDNFTRYLESEL